MPAVYQTPGHYPRPNSAYHPGPPMGVGMGYGVDPVMLAMKRPVQVTVFGWLQLLASILGVVSGAFLLLFIAGRPGAQEVEPSQVAVIIGEVAWLLLNFGLAIGLLRGSRGPYLFYCTIAVISIVLLAIAVVGTIVGVVLVGVLALAALLVVAVWAAVAAIWAYLLFNPSTKAYFSRRSAQIRAAGYAA